MKKIVLVSFLMVILGFANNTEITTGNKSPVQGNGGIVNYYNINVRTTEEAVRLQQALAKTPKPTPTVPTKTVVPPKAPAPVVTVPKPKPKRVHHEVVSDAHTTVMDGNLQWQDNSDAKTVKKDWEGAKSYCANLTLDGYSDWRLPSKEELESIVDKSRTPTIKKGFKNTTDDWYWSASPDVNYGSNAWIVFFYGGRTNSTTLRRIRIMCGVWGADNNFDSFVTPNLRFGV